MFQRGFSTSLSTLLDLATVEKKSALCGVTWRKRRTMAAAREFFSLRTASVSKPQKCTMSVLVNLFPVVLELLSFLSLGDYGAHMLTLWLMHQLGGKFVLLRNCTMSVVVNLCYGCW